MSDEEDERLKDRILSEKVWGELGQIRELLVDVATKEDIKNLRDDIDELKAIQQVHGDILKDHSAGIRELKADVKVLKDDMGEVKADLKEVRQIVAQHSEDITELKIDVKDIKDAVVGVQATSHTHA